MWVGVPWETDTEMEFARRAFIADGSQARYLGTEGGRVEGASLGRGRVKQ